MAGTKAATTQIVAENPVRRRSVPVRQRPDHPTRIGHTIPRTLLIADAARVMGVSRRTVYYRIREGHLASIKTRCGSRRVIVQSWQSLLRLGERKNASAYKS